MRFIGAVFYGLLSDYDQGLIWGGIQHRNYDRDKKQCKPHAKGIDMWYIRTSLQAISTIVYLWSND